MKKKIIIGSALVLVLIAIVAVNIVRSNQTVPAFTSGMTFNVKVQSIAKGNITSSASASGVVEEIEKGEVFLILL